GLASPFLIAAMASSRSFLETYTIYYLLPLEGSALGYRSNGANFCNLCTAFFIFNNPNSSGDCLNLVGIIRVEPEICAAGIWINSPIAGVDGIHCVAVEFGHFKNLVWIQGRGALGSPRLTVDVGRR